MHTFDVRVLVVDNGIDAADASARAPQADGYPVRIANDGETALSVVDAFQPHCVLLDIDVPTMDGQELASRLRLRHGDSIVSIMVTGWGRADDRFTAAFVRFDHCLRKPFETASLHKVLPPLQ